MKRSVFDVLRRGLDNAIANWQLLLLRIGEAFLFGIIIVIAILAAIVPILLSIGVKLADFQVPETAEGALTALLSRWPIFAWIFGGAVLLALLFMVVHSFLEAGCARVYVDGDRIAGAALAGPRSRYRVFSMAKWWAGAVDGWWPVFWIYNIAWGIAALFFLVPLLFTSLLVLALAMNDSAGPAIGIGCVGAAASFMIMIPTMIVAGIWSNRAIASWAVRRGGARDTTRAAWAAFKADMGRHLLVAIALFVISMAGSMFIGSFGFFIGFAEVLGRHSGSTALMMMPARFFIQMLSTAFSTVIAGWFLATFCAMANEG